MLLYCYIGAGYLMCIIIFVAVLGIVLYIDVGHCILGTCWLRGLGMLGMSCYVYVSTRHVRWDDARACVIMCVHRAGKSTI